jgi:chaperonin GroEL (HSP60 family)
MSEIDEIQKLAHIGLRKLGTVLIQIRAMTSRSASDLDGGKQLLIGQMADAMHNVPRALEELVSKDSQVIEGRLQWAKEEITRATAKADRLWIKYNQLLAEGD